MEQNKIKSRSVCRAEDHTCWLFPATIFNENKTYCWIPWDMIVTSIKSWSKVKEFLNLRLVEVDLRRQKESLKPQLYRLHKPAESRFIVLIHFSRKQRKKVIVLYPKALSRQAYPGFLIVHLFILFSPHAASGLWIAALVFLSFHFSSSNLLLFLLIPLPLYYLLLPFEGWIGEGDGRTIIPEVSCL